MELEFLFFLKKKKTCDGNFTAWNTWSLNLLESISERKNLEKKFDHWFYLGFPAIKCCLSLIWSFARLIQMQMENAVL